MPALLSLLALASGCSTSGMFWRIQNRSIAALTRTTPPAPVHVGQPYRRDARLAVLWVGHATALIQLDDKVVLTDPVFTSRVGGLSPRLVAPGLRPSELPPIDAAVISHMHFDHYSYDSVREIASRTKALLLPEGAEDYVHAYSFEEAFLRPWESWEQGGLRITAVPVKHKGWRWGFDAALEPKSFTGYVIEYHGLTVYFGGDTALAPELFAATRQRFPHIDLALLPIGPIAPRDFMSRTHVDPGQALEAFRMLGARQMVPVHYDTFINSDDEVGDCGRALDAAMAASGLTEKEVVRLKIGEQRVFIPREGAAHIARR